MPPDRFWQITPRLYDTEMKGAVKRIRRERAMVWDGAFLPHQKKPPTFSEYVGGEPPKPEPAEFLDMRLRASVKGLKGITMAEYRASRH